MPVNQRENERPKADAWFRKDSSANPPTHYGGDNQHRNYTEEAKTPVVVFCWALFLCLLLLPHLTMCLFCHRTKLMSKPRFDAKYPMDT